MEDLETERKARPRWLTVPRTLGSVVLGVGSAVLVARLVSGAVALAALTAGAPEVSEPASAGPAPSWAAAHGAQVSAATRVSQPKACMRR